jgi:hypothetical protein
MQAPGVFGRLQGSLPEAFAADLLLHPPIVCIRWHVRYAIEDSVTVRVIFLRRAGVTRE